MCAWIITISVSLGLIAVYALLCQRLPAMPVAEAAANDDDAYLAMLAVTHHDIWWAKEHAWTIVSAALAILVTVLVVDMVSKRCAAYLELQMLAATMGRFGQREAALDDVATALLCRC